tara:strand:+ start:118 stop:324 length:207 start_codon:yes stop_codon:yes gene_type:complete
MKSDDWDAEVSEILIERYVCTIDDFLYWKKTQPKYYHLLKGDYETRPGIAAQKIGIYLGVKLRTKETG